MVLELHIWGPAFGLPSMDAHCLAMVAYMRHAIPRGQWVLVASSDPTLSPTNELPALRDTTHEKWVGGYKNIISFLSKYSDGKWDLDSSLRKQEGADCTAYSAFIQLHAQPLLDLSLYVSSQNYSEITRPLFNTIQSFPLPYLTPPHLRKEAKKRTEYLGLDALDIDTEDDAKSKSRESSIIPESLRRGTQTVSSLLASTPEAGAQIRLDALASNFFEAIEELKGGKKYLVSNTTISSLDCLALGFMSLMFYPQLPQPWLQKTMRKKFPDLIRWVKELNDEMWGVVTLDDALLTGRADAVQRMKEQVLPWQAHEARGILNVGSVFLGALVDSLPIVGQQRKESRMRQYSGGEETANSGSRVWRYVATVGSVVAAVGLVASYALHQGLIQVPENWPGKKEDEGEKTQGLNDLGEAGQALFAFADQMDGSVQKQRTRED